MSHNLPSKVDNRHCLGDCLNFAGDAAATLNEEDYCPVQLAGRSLFHPLVPSRQLTRLLDLGRLPDGQECLDRLA
jgi:hypothetical protein